MACRGGLILRTGATLHPMNDPKVIDYTEELSFYWDTLLHAWAEHCDQHPVLECDLAARRVAAYPAIDYLNDLSVRTRQAAIEEYERTTREGGMMVFILDSEREVLQSYSFLPQAQPDARGRPGGPPAGGQPVRPERKRTSSRGGSRRRTLRKVK